MKTISCCIVVKNERNRIIDNLSRLIQFANEVIIIDTGSTDNTPNVIRGWADVCMKNRVKVFEVGDMFHDEDNDFHFGNAKTYALEKANGDYVMWLDANDMISDPVLARKYFDESIKKNPNIYIVMPTQLSDKFAFMRARCAPRGKCNVTGRVHEYLNILDNLERTFIPIPIINKKVESRDLERNLRLLQKDWAENETARNTFYIAQTLREMNEHEDCIKWFRKRIYQFEFKDEYLEEFYKSIESICEILVVTMYEGWVAEDIKDFALELIRLIPSRMEGHFYLGKYYMMVRDFEKALECFRKYPVCRIPEKYNLWLNRDIYNGTLVMKEIEYCKVAIKNKDVLEPEEIIDMPGSKKNSRYDRGSAQYTVQ